MSTRAFLCTALAALCAACYGPEEFQEESALARCALYEECGYLSYVDVENYDQCLDLLRSEAYACEEFQVLAADECIEALDEMSCEAYVTDVFPTACADACIVAED